MRLLAVARSGGVVAGVRGLVGGELGAAGTNVAREEHATGDGRADHGETDQRAPRADTPGDTSGPTAEPPREIGGARPDRPSEIAAVISDRVESMLDRLGHHAAIALHVTCRLAAVAKVDVVERAPARPRGTRTGTLQTRAHSPRLARSRSSIARTGAESPPAVAKRRHLSRGLGRPSCSSAHQGREGQR